MGNSEKKMCTIIFIFGICLCGLLVFVISMGMIEKTSGQSVYVGSGNVAEPMEPEELDLRNVFDRYVYYEEHDDGSSVNYAVYRFKNNYYTYMRFTDVSGGCFVDVRALDDRSRSVFENNYMDFSVVQQEDRGRSASLSFESSSGGMVYKVDPLDISGIGFSDPWGDSRSATITQVSNDVLLCYNVDAIRKQANCLSDEEFAAYISCLHKQLRQASPDGTVSYVDVTGYMDGGYIISVITESGDTFRMCVTD